MNEDVKLDIIFINSKFLRQNIMSSFSNLSLVSWKYVENIKRLKKIILWKGLFF